MHLSLASSESIMQGLRQQLAWGYTWAGTTPTKAVLSRYHAQYIADLRVNRPRL